ncbi:hypothetical protein A2609_02920 [Candidatus Kaiserbacteria bacterium RIFOXYD1_FULL_47_14]|uniref:Uncharacterized protein n=1 Tax=Candidatus Kaiserbacteria bacterium RIFOXYD1_FULL_47_14 TaxID=1798533 RepID=A0A1F6G7Z6_9BACT|nr:MAG: hypothetical protein A2609_02920 [Candidatus Kaiserbacteria bacterium RIFOXYD1_FULL_47_14]
METITQQHPKFVRWALMLGIIVILNVFFTVIVALAYPAPEYNTYCPNIQEKTAPADAVICDAQGGIWNAYAPAPVSDVSLPKVTTTGYCDMYAKCQKPYQAAQDQHALYAFVLMIGLGIVALVIGLIPFGSSIISSGLSYGGVLAFIIGSIQYWGTAGNWIRLAISAVGLIALLYIGWRRFRD